MAALTFDDLVAKAAPQKGGALTFDDLAPATPEYGKAAATGGRKLVEGTLGTIGDISQAQRAGVGWLMRKLGAPEEVAADAEKYMPTIGNMINPGSYFSKSGDMPTTSDISKAVDTGVNQLQPDAAKTVQDYTKHEPKNWQESAVETGVQMAPAALAPVEGAGVIGNLLTRAGRVALPTAGTEVGGEVGKELGNETAGRLIGGVVAGGAPGVLRRAVSGAPVTGERADLARYLMDQGVDLTAGDIRGGGRKFLESGLFGGKPGALAEEQKTQFNRAALRPAGITADNAAPQVMEQAQHNFDNRYDDIVARNNGVPLDNQMLSDLVNTTDNFHQLKSIAPNAPSIVNNYLQRISNAVQSGGGTIQPDVFRTLRNDITKSILDSSDFETKNALRDFRDHMYDSIGRNGQPDLIDELQQTNRQYRNFKIVEKAMSAAGADPSLGNVSPARLRGAVAGAEGKAGYTQGRGDLNELARAGDVFLKDVPNSGTAGRAGPMYLGAALAHAGSQLVAGDVGGSLLTAGGAFAPGIVRRAVTSGPVRRAAVNNMLNPQPTINPVVQALMLRQAMSGGGY